MATTHHQRPPFRAEHLGSLLRPASLLAQRQHVHAGSAAASTLPPLEDAAIDTAIALQRRLGFHALSDGEYRRHMFWGSFFPSLHGMREVHGPAVDLFRAYVPDVAAFIEEREIPGETVVCVGPVRHPGVSTYVEQVRYLQAHVPREMWAGVKLTVAAPNWYHLRYREGHAYPKDVYASDAAYFADVAAAYREELRILYDAGLRNVQFDDPNLVYFCSEKMLEGWAADAANETSADETFDAYIQLYNDCIRDVPDDMHIGVHLCRGNFVNSRHFSEGGYDRIAARLFQKLNVSTYYLEYDTARAGGFGPLEHLPKHKNVVLGVVTSKFPQLEDKEEMKARVLSAADIVAKGSGQSREEALKRLRVSPQCGFASHAGGNLVTMEDMEKKLALVRQIADEIWPGEA